MGLGVISVEPSARQDAMNSWRRGFIRWRIREGPIGSHQELASAEKWESSSGETEEVEWERIGVGVGDWLVWRAESVCFNCEGRLRGWIERMARGRAVLARKEAMLGVDVMLMEN